MQFLMLLVQFTKPFKFGLFSALLFAALAACSSVKTATPETDEAFFSDENFNIQERDITTENEFLFDQDLQPSDYLVDQNSANNASNLVQSPELQQKIVYFDNNQDRISPTAFATLDAHAQNIRQLVLTESNLVVVIEGHADERGTREYNIGLGQRRAEAVSRYLRVRGVPSSVIRTVSFGEEAPIAQGSDETAWRLNRRAELKY